MVEILDAGVCRFCGASTPLIPICATCAKRLAHLIRGSARSSLRLWWCLPVDPTASGAPGELTRKTVADHAVKVRLEAWDAEQRTWVQFDASAQPLDIQAVARAELARAYLEMRLLDDALIMAAEAVDFGDDAATRQALTVLFHPRLLRPGAERTLREVLFPG